MRKLKFLISDVRESTDNKDVNAISDKEFVRYFNDCVRSIQSIVLKNNPRAAYFQDFIELNAPLQGRWFDLPEDCFAFNAVTFVEVLSESSINDYWYRLEQVTQEDQNYFFGWFTKNKQIFFTGRNDVQVGNSCRVWYFKKIPSWQIPVAKILSIVGNEINLTSNHKLDYAEYITVYSKEGVKRGSFEIDPDQSTATKIVSLDALTGVIPTDLILPEKNSVLDVELPDEVETYLLDYVSKRIYSRNNYREDTNQVALFSDEAKANITAIFGDMSNTIIRPPITDTSFLEV